MSEWESERGDPLPKTPGEVRDALLRLVWEQRADLKGVALVQALNSLAKLAAAEPEAAPSAAPVDVLDLIRDEGLLPDRKRTLLNAERVIVAARLTLIDTELEAIQ